MINIDKEILDAVIFEIDSTLALMQIIENLSKNTNDFKHTIHQYQIIRERLINTSLPMLYSLKS